MRTTIRLSTFGLTVAAVFAASWALGAAVGPSADLPHPVGTEPLGGWRR